MALLDLSPLPPATPLLAADRREIGIGPNWFAAVMGTGIVANAAATLPISLPGLTGAARGLWLADAALLVGLLALVAADWRRRPETLRAHLADPTMAHFFGAPAMAFLTVGAGALLLGVPVLGAAAPVVAGALWAIGSALGIATAVGVPVRAFCDHLNPGDAAFGGWLMPVVPPMVSAATGPLFAPHLPAGQARETLLLVCALMFGAALVASLVVIAQIWSRLMHHGVGAALAVPTLWIVLGPLGQSATAAHTISSAVEVTGASMVHVLAVVFAAGILGFAFLWAAIAVAITLRTVRTGMPFAPTWWSFTFPVGTVVTGVSGLAAATGLIAVEVLAVAGYAVLVAAWLVVAGRTVAHVAARLNIR